MEPILLILCQPQANFRPRLVISSASAFADLDTANESRYSLYVSPSHDRLISMITILLPLLKWSTLRLWCMTTLLADHLKGGACLLSTTFGNSLSHSNRRLPLLKSQQYCPPYAHIGIAGLLNDAVELMCRGSRSR